MQHCPVYAVTLLKAQYAHDVAFHLVVALSLLFHNLLDASPVFLRKLVAGVSWCGLFLDFLLHAMLDVGLLVVRLLISGFAFAAHIVYPS